MTDVAIRIEGLSKLYRLGQAAAYHRFSELVTGLAMAPFRAVSAALATPSRSSEQTAASDRVSSDDTQRNAPPGHFWALRDLNLDIKQGEVVGIIGRNGAGKSTLLKVLSRITEPTEGRITLRGRVGSLLEVGTGFHPELTGRENIFLNGAILGMTRAEVRRNFDQIVAFSEVERFLDTPVKHYSSGMYMRLAFSVAAHLNPEILIVDEVLAVGDVQFRRKCLGKMHEVSTSGRTVLFVSHDMSSIRQLCTRAVMLDAGRVLVDGDPPSVTARYERPAATDVAASQAISIRQPVPSGFHFTRAELRDNQGNLRHAYEAGENVELHLFTSGPAPQGSFTVEFILYNAQGNRISFGAANPVRSTYFGKEDRHIVCKLSRLPLTSGRYQFDISARVWGMERWDLWERAVGLEITRCDLFGTGHDIPGGAGGDFVMEQEWSGTLS